MRGKMVEISRILFYEEDKKKGDRLCGGQMPRCNNKKMSKDFYFLKNESATHSSAVKASLKSDLRLFFDIVQ